MEEIRSFATEEEEEKKNYLAGGELLASELDRSDCASLAVEVPFWSCS